MTSKEHPIKILEQALEYEEKQLDECHESVKSLKNRVIKDENLLREVITRISDLKDAIHKLKDLANLEEKNKIADSAEMAEHQILRKGPTRTQLKWKNVEDMEIRKFIKDFILPEITQLLKDRQYTFHEQLKEALK